jgi:hypothetical protein
MKAIELSVDNLNKPVEFVEHPLDAYITKISAYIRCSVRNSIQAYIECNNKIVMFRNETTTVLSIYNLRFFVCYGKISFCL